MSDKAKKPIGLRLSANIWDNLKTFGLEHYPSDKSSEGFDVTRSIEYLLSKSLDIPLDIPLDRSLNRPLDKLLDIPLDTRLDERITEIVKRELEKLKEVEPVQVETDKLREVEPIQVEIEKPVESIEPGEPEPVQVEKKKAKTTKRTRSGDEVSWEIFHERIGLPTPPDENRSKSNVKIAIDRARELGMGKWICDKGWNFHLVLEQIGQIETEPDTI